MLPSVMHKGKKKKWEQRRDVVVAFLSLQKKK